MTEIRAAQVEARREAESSGRTSARKSSHRPKDPGSQRSVAAKLGIPRETIRDTERHVDAGEKYPLLQAPAWKKYQALEAAEKLDTLDAPVVAAFTTADPLALDERGEVIGPVLRGPVSLADAAGMRALRPPVAMMRSDRVPDAEGSIDVDDLPGQIAALRASATVGGLNVEQLAGRKLVITTHAETQSERDGWLRSLRGAA